MSLPRFLRRRKNRPPRVQPGLRGLPLLDAVIAHIAAGGRWDQSSWPYCVAGLACRIHGDTEDAWNVVSGPTLVPIRDRARELLGPVAEQQIQSPRRESWNVEAHFELFRAGATLSQIKAVRRELGP